MRAAIGIGANLGDAAGAVRAAIEELSRAGTLVARSSLYRSQPWGVLDQPPFVNAAAIVETALEPHALLRVLKQIEDDLGRTPTYRWGPRAIDLDILTFGELTLNASDLVIPHPRLAERAFVLVPLAEVDAAFGPLLDALDERERAAVTRYGSSD